MALFTDGNIATISELREYESSILSVANTEGIDLSHKLDLAKREVGLELAAFLVQRGVDLGPERTLEKVVVTEPLLHWVIVQGLALVYRDAYNSQMNDRYRGKWEEFQRVAHNARCVLRDIGVGMTGAPIPKAPSPVVGSVGGSVLPAATYCVRIAWQGLSSSTGAWSDAAVLSVDPGMRVTALIPPAPQGVSGAIVYAGESESAMFRQTDAVVAPGSTWTQPISGLRTDLLALRVQSPDYYVANRREMLRG